MKDIYKGLDLSEETIATLTERIESHKQGWIDGAKNDPEFITQIRQEEAGKFFTSMEKTLKKNLDIKPEDIEGDVSGLKKMELMLKVGIKSFEQNKDKTNQELQDELLRVRAEKKELEEEKIPTLIQEERKKHFQRYISESILKDTLGFETTCNERARVSIVSSFLQEKGLRTEWDNDLGEYKVLTKENLKFTDGQKVLSNKDIVALALEDGGVLKKSNGLPTDPQNPNRPPRVGKLSPNAEAMRASFAD